MFLRFFTVPAFALCFAFNVPAMTPQAQQRFVHSHDATYPEGKTADWRVNYDALSGLNEVRLSAAQAGGYLLLGKKLRVPDEVADARFQVSYRMNFNSGGWRNVAGHLGLVVMTPAEWERLAQTPEAAVRKNFYRDPAWLHHVQLDGFFTPPNAWNTVESPDFHFLLQPYLGRELVFALIWGSTSTGEFELDWKDAGVTFLNAIERERAFLEAFRSDFPGLEAMQSALAADDLEAAGRHLIGYFRERPGPRMPAEGVRDFGNIRRYAELATEGLFFAPGGGLEPLAAPRETMWKHIPGRQEQWPVALNRHYLWAWLADAWAATGEARFLEEFEQQVASWDAAMPVSFGRFFIDGLHDRFGQLPLSLNAGLRMGHTWFVAFDTFRSGASDETLLIMLRWMYEHGRYLMQPVHFDPSNNWGAMQSNGLFHIGLMLPELRDAEKWRNTAEARMVQMLEAQVYPDYVQKELTPAYHWITVEQFAAAVILANFNNLPIPEKLAHTLHGMASALTAIMMPDFRSPDVNDSTRISAERLDLVNRLFPDDDSFQFFLSRGAEGSAPDFTSISFPWAGWQVMRSGWGPRDSVLFFETGPLGVSHHHEDKLSFLLHAHGEMLINEFGFHPYDNSEWLHLARSAFGHNTIIVNGGGQRRAGQGRELLVTQDPADNGLWHSDERIDYALGVYDESFFLDLEGNRHHAIHQREILFIKPSTFVIIDTLEPQEEGEFHYEALFHLTSGAPEIESESGKLTSVTGQARLRMLPLTDSARSVRIVKGQREPNLLGWRSTRNIEEKVPSPVAVFEHRAGGLARMAWLLLAGDKEEIPATVDLAPLAADGLRGTASFTLPDGSRHALTLDEKGLVSLQSIAAGEHTAVTFTPPRNH